MVRERHLGLHMPGDEDVPGDYIARLAHLVEDSLDLDCLLEIAGRAETPSVAVDPPQRPAGQRIRLAVARDAAFCFYYTECVSVFHATLGAQFAEWPAFLQRSSFGEWSK